MLASPDKWLGKAFRLAYFLHGAADAARRVTAQAALRLDVAAAAQGKRLYYQPTGAARSKVYLNEALLLQRLVYAASEPLEREREADAKSLQQSDLLIFFIKHLVRITTKRNSFYVALGLSRVLHNYSTNEAMEIYNLVIQDPDRVPDDYYYRSRKGLLMKELKERFAPFVEIVRAARGEERLQSRAEAGPLATLAQESLEWFTPWATDCAVPERFDPLAEQLPQLHFTGQDPDEEHRIEVNRIHATLHPQCFSRLAAANGYAPPDERLEIPLFAVAEDDDGNAGPRRPPDASDEDLEFIKNTLSREEARRKTAHAGLLRVLADGEEKARLNTEQTARAAFRIDEGTEIIEVYGRDAEGELLLAAYLPDWETAQQKAEMRLPDGKRLTFGFDLQRDKEGFPECAQITLDCRVTGWARWREVLALPMLWKPALAFGALALFAAAAWFAWQSVRQPSVGPITQNLPTPTATAPTTPDSATTPTPAATPETVKPKSEIEHPKSGIPQATPAPKPQAPSPKPQAQTPLTAQRDKPRRDDGPLPPRDDDATPPDADATRSGAWDVKLLGLPLSQMRRVTVQAVGDETLRQELVTALNASLAGSRLSPAPDAESAEGALKITVRPAAQPGRVVVNVFLVNDKGTTVWPFTRKGAARRYAGTPATVAARLSRELNAAANGK